MAPAGSRNLGRLGQRGLPGGAGSVVTAAKLAALVPFCRVSVSVKLFPSPGKSERRE